MYQRSLAITRKGARSRSSRCRSGAEQSGCAVSKPRPLRRRRAVVPALIGDSRKGARSRSSRCRNVAEQSGCAVSTTKAATPMPSRFTSAHWRFRKRRSVPIIPMSRTSLNNLAELYHDQGRYADAEPLYQRSLAISEKALGPDHPDVATSLNNLAGLYETKAATPMPSRCTSAHWRFAKRRSVPIIPMSQSR